MIIGTTSYPGTIKRSFYGLKQNGRPFFKDKETNEETFHYSKEVVGEDYSEGKYESESIIIKHSNTIKSGKINFNFLFIITPHFHIFPYYNNHNIYRRFFKEKIAL